jgi:hypothetical protein
MTQTSSDETTIEYRDDRATRVPVTVIQADITGVVVVVRPPGR